MAQGFVSGYPSNPILSTLRFNPTTNGIIGTPTNDNAIAGVVGEYVTASVASGSAVTLSSGISGNITSISLTAGDWDVIGQVLGGGSVSTTSLQGWCSTTSATLADPNYTSIVGTFGGAGLTTPKIRVSIASTTTVYLSARIAGSGTITGWGVITARRVR